MPNLSLAPESLYNLHMSPERIDPWLIVYAVGLERGVCTHDRCIDRIIQGIMWLAIDTRIKTPSDIVNMLDAQCDESGLVVAEVPSEQPVIPTPEIRHMRLPQLIAA